MQFIYFVVRIDNNINNYISNWHVTRGSIDVLLGWNQFIYDFETMMTFAMFLKFLFVSSPIQFVRSELFIPLPEEHPSPISQAVVKLLRDFFLASTPLLSITSGTQRNQSKAYDRSQQIISQVMQKTNNATSFRFPSLAHGKRLFRYRRYSLIIADGADGLR